LRPRRRLVLALGERGCGVGARRVPRSEPVTAPLRVCLVTPELPPYRVGGIGTYVAALAEEFGRRGHAVDVVGCDIHPDEPVVAHAWGRSLSLRADSHPLGGAWCRAIEDGVRWTVRRNVPCAWRVYP